MTNKWKLMNVELARLRAENERLRGVLAEITVLGRDSQINDEWNDTEAGGD